MAETSMPPWERPFTVKVDGKVVPPTLNSWEEMQALVEQLRRRHGGPADRVQAFDRWDRRCDERPLGDR